MHIHPVLVELPQTLNLVQVRQRSVGTKSTAGIDSVRKVTLFLGQSQCMFHESVMHIK